jgi:hypothetical protein
LASRRQEATPFDTKELKGEAGLITRSDNDYDDYDHGDGKEAVTIGSTLDHDGPTSVTPLVNNLATFSK